MQREERRAVRPGSRAVCYTTLQYGTSLPVGDHPDRQNADFQALQRRLVSFSTPSAACKSMEASILTDASSLHIVGPVLVKPSSASRQQLGLKVPATSKLKPPQLMEHLGFMTEAAIAAGDGREDAPRWNLLQWLQYWSTRQLPQTDGASTGFERTKSVNSIEDEADSRDVRRREWEAYVKSVELPEHIAKGISAEARRRPLSMTVSLSGSSMEDDFAAPAAVVEHDLAERHWPAEKGTTEPRSSRPIKQLHMAPAGAFSNFAMAPGGASTWIHVISGRKVFILIPNTPVNLSTHASWHGRARKAGNFLPEHASGALKVTVEAGATLFIPAGWVHAEMTTEDTLALRGLSLQLQHIRAHLEAARIEEYLDLRPALRFPRFYEVLWHTAAALSKDLVQAAQLPAEGLSEQTTELGAERRRRQQHAIAVPAQSEPNAGTDSDDDFGRPYSARLRRAQAPGEARTGFVIKEVSPGDEEEDDMALQRPRKRLKRRSSLRNAEVADDLEDDLQDETLEDDEDEDEDSGTGSPPSMNPPRAAARAPKQATETAYYSDSPEEEVDEELRAMQNIRNRGRRRHDAEGQQLLPKVKLRSGLRDKGAGSLKVRLKALEPDRATGSRQPGSMRGRAATASGQQQLPRLHVKLNGLPQQSPPRAAAQQVGSGQRNPSLRVKLRVNSLEGSIPQTDGAADSGDDHSALPSQLAMAAGDSHKTRQQELHAANKPGSGLQQPQEPCRPAEDPQQPMRSTAPFDEVAPSHTADLKREPAAAPDLLASTQNEQAGSMPSITEAATADPHRKHISRQSAEDEYLAADKPSLANGDIPGQTRSGLTSDKLAVLPVLVSALREWLNAQAGRIPGIGDQEDAQEALDVMEVCLRALGKPVEPIRYAVDFSKLPLVPVPSAQPAPLGAGSSDAEDSGARADGRPSADEADDTAPEELGDSVHEAENRAARRGGRGGSGARGAKKKPTVKDRLAKKLRLG